MSDDDVVRRALALLADQSGGLGEEAQHLVGDVASGTWWRKARMLLADSLLESLDDKTRFAVEAAMKAAVAQEFEGTGL
jgi:hypothetical protein